MKLLLLGATGATGRLVAQLAARRGHELRALVRTPAGANLPDTVEVIQGDARSAEHVTGAMDGMDAVVSALGMGLQTRPNGLMTAATGALIRASERTGVDRLVMLSSWGVGETLRRSSLRVRLLYQAGKRVHDEKAEAELELRASDLRWTLAYPVALTDGPATKLVIARDVDEVDRIPGMPSIPREDVADFLVDTVESGAWVRKAVALTTA